MPRRRVPGARGVGVGASLAPRSVSSRPAPSPCRASGEPGERRGAAYRGVEYERAPVCVLRALRQATVQSLCTLKFKEEMSADEGVAAFRNWRDCPRTSFLAGCHVVPCLPHQLFSPAVGPTGSARARCARRRIVALLQSSSDRSAQPVRSTRLRNGRGLPCSSCLACTVQRNCRPLTAPPRCWPQGVPPGFIHIDAISILHDVRPGGAARREALPSHPTRRAQATLTSLRPSLRLRSSTSRTGAGRTCRPSWTACSASARRRRVLRQPWKRLLGQEQRVMVAAAGSARPPLRAEGARVPARA